MIYKNPAVWGKKFVKVSVISEMIRVDGCALNCKMTRPVSWIMIIRRLWGE